MTPFNPHAPPQRSGSHVAITVGLALALSCIGSGGMFGLYRVFKTKERVGWNLVPIVVAAVDVPENETITFEMISQRSIPEQFANGNMVKPDSASYVVNVRSLRALQAGDPLRWSDLYDAKSGERLMLFAKRDLAVGESIAPEDVVAHPIEPALVTASWFEQGALPADRKVSVAVRAGEPLLSSHFAPPGATP
jgi:Flp pilus assembly protein CpaB